MTTRERPTLHLEVDITLRLAAPDDLPKLEWYGQYAHYRTLYRYAYREQRAGRRLMLVADFNGFPVGQIFVQLASNDHRIADGVTRGYLYALRVMEMFRGQGVGTRLIVEAESRLLNLGFDSATIAVSKENQGALDLYKRIGYRIFRDDPGEWNYRDHRGITRSVREPCWILEKELHLR